MKIFLHGNLFQGKLTEDLLRVSVERLIKRLMPDAQIMTLMDVPEESRNDKGFIDWLNSNVSLLLLIGGALLGGLHLPLLPGTGWLKKRKFDIAMFGVGYRKDDKKLGMKEKETLTGLLGAVKFLSVRGNKTAEVFKKMGLKPEVVGDPVFSFEYSDLTAWIDSLVSTPRPMVAVNLRHLSAEESPKKSLCTDFVLNIFSGLLKNDFAEYGKVFLPFSLPSMPDGDKELSLELQKKDINISLAYWNLDKMASLIREVDFMLSMRLHPILLALKFGVPTYLIDYQYDKLADALSAEGLDKATKGLGLFNANSMAQPFGGLNVADYIKKYQEKAPAIQKAIEKLAEKQLQYIKRILKGK